MDQQQKDQQQDVDTNDLALGREAIGKELGGLTPSQVSYFLAQGLLDGAAKRISHRIIIGSKRRLRELAAKLIDQSS